MAGYRLHIEATTTTPTAHADMASVRAEIRRLALESGRTVADVTRIAYIITEAEYQAELSEGSIPC